MRNNGQALIEFIIVLPILIIILLGVIDFSVIFYEKNLLENNLDEVKQLWDNNKSEDEIKLYLNKLNKKIEYEEIKDDKTITLILKQKYNIVTPGLNLILTNPYEIEVSRVIYNE